MFTAYFGKSRKERDFQVNGGRLPAAQWGWLRDISFCTLKLAGNAHYLAARLKTLLLAFLLSFTVGKSFWTALNIHLCLPPRFFCQQYLIALRIGISLSINLRSKCSHYNQCSYQRAQRMVLDLGPSINRWIEQTLVVPYVHSLFIYWEVLHQPQFRPSCFTAYYYNLLEIGIYRVQCGKTQSLVHLEGYAPCNAVVKTISFETPGIILSRIAAHFFY